MAQRTCPGGSSPRCRRWLVGTLCGAAVFVVAACGGGGTGPGNGSGNGPSSSAITPSDALLDVGQSAYYAVVPTDPETRHEQSRVVVNGWRILDPAIATVTGTGERATVTGLAVGQTTLTASTDGGDLRATVRVGPENLPQATLEELAGFLTDAAADGALTNAPTERPVDLDAPQSLVDDLEASLGSPPRLVVWGLDPAVFDRDPVTVDAGDLSLEQGPQTSRGYTNDGQMDAEILAFIIQLGRAGFNDTAFRSAWRQAEFHQEGGQASGLMLKVSAVTFFPGGPTIYDGSIVYPGGSMTHTVFPKATAADIRAGNLIKDDHVTEAGSTVLHELAHCYVFQTHHGDIDPETVAGPLEGLLRGLADVALTTQAGTPDPTALARVFANYHELTLQPTGYEVLNLFALRKPPASPNLTAPREVNVGQTFSVPLSLRGQNALPNENVLVNVIGAVAQAGLRVVRTDSAGAAQLQLQAGSAEGVIYLNARFLGDSRSAEIAVVDPNHPSPYVVLDQTLTSASENVYPAGSVIFLKRVTNGKVAGPEAGCNHDHLHGPFIDIDGDGPLADPDPDHCGYGLVYHGTVGPVGGP